MQMTHHRGYIKKTWANKLCIINSANLQEFPSRKYLCEILKQQTQHRYGQIIVEMNISEEMHNLYSTKSKKRITKISTS